MVAPTFLLNPVTICGVDPSGNIVPIQVSAAGNLAIGSPG